jgi:two-component system chemotaxis response regulator CheB
VSTQPRRVIALVSSVGGLKATSAVLEALPATLPAAVIVLQHQQPEGPGLLPGVLARCTSLTVRTAVDGAALEAGVVEVAPPGHHTLVTHARRLSLVESGAFPPSRPSADLLLTTLALAYGPDAIAVVLSGGGHDAATGSTVVHHHRGIVLVTDEPSSESFAMPLATIERNDLVDEIVPLTRLGHRLTELVAVDDA